MFKGSLTPLNKARQIQARLMLLKTSNFTPLSAGMIETWWLSYFRVNRYLSKHLCHSSQRCVDGFPPGKATMRVDSLPVLLAASTGTLLCVVARQLANITVLLG